MNDHDSATLASRPGSHGGAETHVRRGPPWVGRRPAGAAKRDTSNTSNTPRLPAGAPRWTLRAPSWLRFGRAGVHRDRSHGGAETHVRRGPPWVGRRPAGAAKRDPSNTPRLPAGAPRWTLRAPSWLRFGRGRIVNCHIGLRFYCRDASAFPRGKVPDGTRSGAFAERQGSVLGLRFYCRDASAFPRGKVPDGTRSGAFAERRGSVLGLRFYCRDASAFPGGKVPEGTRADTQVHPHN